MSTESREASPIPILMPILGARDYTVAAIADCLAQTVPIRLLLINQGVDDAFRDELERIAEAHSDRILLWSHQPSLPALAATWNAGLDWAWASGADVALVINNDVRLHPQTVAILAQQLDQQAAWFVSAVGVTPAQFDPQQDFEGMDWGQHGGPDFSCFLISRACHEAYRFDEGFVPAYCEDLDYHRRLLLEGDGTRIFSINLPYLHYAAATLKGMAAEQRAQHERAISAGSRAHYARKWGGPVNQERYRRPCLATRLAASQAEIDALYGAVDDGSATTPALQAKQTTT